MKDRRPTFSELRFRTLRELREARNSTNKKDVDDQEGKKPTKAWLYPVRASDGTAG